jgi:SH3-like domain-containing protein
LRPHELNILTGGEAMKRTAFFIILLLLSCSKTIVQKDVPKTEEIKPIYPTAYIIKESVNIRTKPTAKAPIKTQLKDGDKIELIKNQKGWYHITNAENIDGWVRSDMVGPKNLSRTILASAFIDSTLPNFNVKMFFDKKDLYKIVYLIFPDQDYKNPKNLKMKAKKIAKQYQKEVYPGAVELRIMRTDEKTLFKKIKLKPRSIADIPHPIIRHGRLIELSVNSKDELIIKIVVPDSIGNQKLLKMAKNISKIYDYRIKKIEIFMGLDSQEGIEYLKRPKDHKKSTLCKLYYLEDAAGEYHSFKQCFE